jgi:hypothetical protein
MEEKKSGADRYLDIGCAKCGVYGNTHSSEGLPKTATL